MTSYIVTPLTSHLVSKVFVYTQCWYQGPKNCECRVCLRYRGALQHRGDVNVLRSEELLEGLLRSDIQRLHLQSARRVEPGGR